MEARVVLAREVVELEEVGEEISSEQEAIKCLEEEVIAVAVEVVVEVEVVVAGSEVVGVDRVVRS